jgi:TPR repeat protein
MFICKNIIKMALLEEKEEENKVKQKQVLKILQEEYVLFYIDLKDKTTFERELFDNKHKLLKNSNDFLINIIYDLIKNKNINLISLINLNSNILASITLSYYYYKTQDYIKAFNLTENLNKENHILQYLLEIYYWDGLCVEENKILSVEYGKKAADNNISTAQCRIGNYYSDEDNQEYNLELAIKSYTKAALQNNTYALFELGDVYYDEENEEKEEKKEEEKIKDNFIIKDDNLAIIYYEKSAQLGLTKARTKLGYIYLQNKYKKNIDLSIFWYSKASESGCRISPNNIGYIYYYGEHIEKNYEKAFFWYSIAAERNFIIARHMISKMYFLGLGVVKNRKKAVECFFELAMDNHKTSIENLILCYKEGYGIKKNKKLARKWEQKLKLA